MVIKQGELAFNLTERSYLGGESVWRNDGIDGDILLLVCASKNTFSYREKKKQNHQQCIALSKPLYFINDLKFKASCVYSDSKQLI